MNRARGEPGLAGIVVAQAWSAISSLLDRNWQLTPTEFFEPIQGQEKVIRNPDTRTRGVCQWRLLPAHSPRGVPGSRSPSGVEHQHVGRWSTDRRGWVCSLLKSIS